MITMSQSHLSHRAFRASRRRSQSPAPDVMSIVTSGRAIAFYAHFIAYTFVALIVLVTAGVFPMLMVALSWGIGLALHGFFGLIVPMLRAPAALERAFARETAEVRAQAAQLDAQRARSLEELSAAIAHEIRNPITAAKSLVQQIAEDPGALETREHAHVAVAELDRVERSIAHLLRFAREEAFEPAPVDLNALIDSAIELLRDRAQRANVRIERDLERMPSLYADAEQLRKVLANLIGNALDAHAQRPREGAFVRISAGQNLAGDELWIRVRDNGPGLGPKARQQAFQPFFTDKPGGTGLGLALARKVLARHGGSIELAPARDAYAEGAEFVLSFPRHSQPTEDVF